MTVTVTTDELKRAWRAVEAGHFRHPDSQRAQRRDDWSPDEPVVVVIGVSGRVGASTAATAMAEASGLRVRIVECAHPHRSGLASATTAELGTDEQGWRQGTRGPVLIQRPANRGHDVSELATPSAADVDLTILDAGAHALELDHEDSWVQQTAALFPVVLVTVATVPGLAALNRLLVGDRIGRAWCVVIGPPLNKWPKPLRAAIPAGVRKAIDDGRLTTIHHDPGLAMTGPTARPLPSRVLSDGAAAIAPVLAYLKGATS